MFFFRFGRKRRRDEAQRRDLQREIHPTNVHLERMERCKNCCKSVTTFIFSRVGLCLLIVAYAFGGGMLFQFIEASHEEKEIVSAQKRLNTTVEKLFNRSIESAVLFHSNWSLMARQILEEYQIELVHVVKRGYQGERQPDDNKQWNFPGAILYAITVITTIGYGHITCKTNVGKVATILYAIFGIPLMLLCLANIGSTMADAFRFSYCNVCCSYCNMVKKKRNIRALQSVELSHSPTSGLNSGLYPTKTNNIIPNISTPKINKNVMATNRKRHSLSHYHRDGDVSSDDQTTSTHIDLQQPGTTVTTSSPQNVVEIVDSLSVDYRKVTIPISITLSLLSSYLILGALLFSKWENWEFLDGAYFCFVTLATIGLGDLVPGKSIKSTQVEGKLVICALYVLLGLSLMAMCFNLMQEEVRAKFRRLGNKLGIIDDPNFW
ncbi:unnamed protein product [Didymodactylos carnosus]|uniref:Potassium channel domain-containing protein n=1 Tax=Didymodactylos carnosus TaxID=1234261 RepID=A0A8S2GFW8_9BILA|nr:unnamed protein product [Didymodactylos carnosus]CAF3510480.1 unnamed protein product [Didymodactylos carnosus]